MARMIRSMRARLSGESPNATAFLLISCCLLMAASEASAQRVNWLDPLGYVKPQPVRVNQPDESSVNNKYWVNLSGGGGSSCTQSDPCGSLDDVVGKPGTTGGPAIIYIKGTGHMSWFEDRINGSGNADCRTQSCNSWILIKPWPAGSPGCSSECTATITGDSNISSPSGVHHIMFDGGPDLKIRFNSNGGGGTYANHIMANYVIVYRTQMFCSSSNGELGWAIGDSSVAQHVYFINNEFYGCDRTGDQSSAVYVGPGSGGGYVDFVFQNNIVRGFYGEGIEINPRVTSSGLTIVGNAFHGIGKGTCSSGWQCRPAITVSVQSGGGNNNTVIANNLIWDIGSGCIWDRGGGTPDPVISNNTCFDYGKGSNGGGPNPEGISGYSNSGSATIRNNIIYAPNGTAPFDGSSFLATNNLCGSGESCGTLRKTWSSTTVLSTDPNSPDFMRLVESSGALDSGLSVSLVSSSYNGISRPSGPAYDIGAFEGLSTGTAPPSSAPAPPTDLTAVD